MQNRNRACRSSPYSPSQCKNCWLLHPGKASHSHAVLQCDPASGKPISTLSIDWIWSWAELCRWKGIAIFFFVFLLFVIAENAIHTSCDSPSVPSSACYFLFSFKLIWAEFRGMVLYDSMIEHFYTYLAVPPRRPFKVLWNSSSQYSCLHLYFFQTCQVAFSWWKCWLYISVTNLMKYETLKNTDDWEDEVREPVYHLWEKFSTTNFI